MLRHEEKISANCRENNLIYLIKILLCYIMKTWLLKTMGMSMSDHILNCASFWALDPAERAAVRAYFDPEGVRPELDVRAIYLNTVSRITALMDAERRLSQVRPALFSSMSADQKKALEGELFFVLYQLSSQY